MYQKLDYGIMTQLITVNPPTVEKEEEHKKVTIYVTPQYIDRKNNKEIFTYIDLCWL